MNITVQIAIMAQKMGIMTLVDSAGTSKELKKKELYWIYKLKTCALYGLKERDACEAF